MPDTTQPQADMLAEVERATGPATPLDAVRPALPVARARRGRQRPEPGSRAARGAAPGEPAAASAAAATDALSTADRLLIIDQAAAMLEAIFDGGSIVELRSGFGRALSVALARLEGRAVLALASNPAHLAGAIDADAAAKATWAFGS